jgi:hypothetical protein
LLPEWFRRFGDIPAIAYDARELVDRSKLSGHNAIPEVHVFEFEGERQETLWWPEEEDAGTSASPAHRRAFGGEGDGSTAGLLRNVYEGLELPGEPSDYHFLLQGSAEQLWGRRREEPNVIAEVEKLCWLDIQLAQARPDAVTSKYSAEQSFYSIQAFPQLIKIYEREGFLVEALHVAELAARFDQEEDARQRLVQRIEAVEAETSADQR